VLGIIFVPISTIATVFGTQFFNSVTFSDELPPGALEHQHMTMNPEIWWLAATALPLTLIIIISWLLWEKWGRHGELTGGSRQKKVDISSAERGEIEMTISSVQSG
jgi:heme/copper-type cytochrome/quinol oxidase subunit 2